MWICAECFKVGCGGEVLCSVGRADAEEVEEGRLGVGLREGWRELRRGKLEGGL